MDSEAIRAELEAARQYEEKAREHKRQAGSLICLAVTEMGCHKVATTLGMDLRKIELLQNMAVTT